MDRKLLHSSALALSLVLFASGPVRAQSTPAPAAKTVPKPVAKPAVKPKTPAPTDEDDEPQEVVVTGKKLPGSVIGDIKPEETFTPAQIQSFGVSTITELLDELAPETRSDRGRGGESPVVLLNGHRISSFAEIRDIPTEAILRVEILPEEVSLKYGYTANQRVVNIVLRRRFRATTAEGTLSAPTEGGQIRGQAEGDLFHLRGDNRLNIDLKYTGNTDITDADRGVIEQNTGTQYDLIGNVVSPTKGAQIDPALSALAGQPVTIAGVPASAASTRPALSDFVPTANVANTSDIGRYRTLSPTSNAVTLNAVQAQPGPFGSNVTLNGTLGATRTDALQGLPGLTLTVPNGDPFSPFGQPVNVLRYDNGFGALTQTTEGWTAHLGMTANKDTDDWRYSLTSAYDHADSITDTDTGLSAAGLQALLTGLSPSFNPFGTLPGTGVTALGQNTARSISDSGNVQFLASGNVIKVPAGKIFTSLKIGDSISNLDSHSLRLGIAQSSDFTRNDFNAQANFDLPLFSAKNHFVPIFGEVSLNGNVAIDQLSDFGTLVTYGYGLNWTPIPGLNLIVSQTHDDAAPTQAQLGGPLVTNFGQRLFDYATGQTVLVTSISGGNANLIADSRTVSKIGLTLKPASIDNLTITASYIHSDIKNPIATFPAATAAIEAAFPDRFVRDASGQLTQVDFRPVNFADQSRSEIRWGFNYTMDVGPAPPPRPNFRRPRPPTGADGATPPPDGEASAGSPPDGGGPPSDGGGNRRDGGGFGGGGGSRGGGGGFGGGGRGGRGGGAGLNPVSAASFAARQSQQGHLQFAVFHTVFFSDQILVRQGGPVLDLLNGSAANSSGGQPRNEVEAQLGYTQAGFGGRMSFDWKEGTEVNGPAASTGNLNFSDISTLNLRLFVNFAARPEIIKMFPFLLGSRLTLSATNLFDQRVKVTDATGATPIGYQPAYLDPVGRVVGVSFRKLFF